MTRANHVGSRLGLKLAQIYHHAIRYQFSVQP
jgi:hypothetical protein